MTSKRLIEVPLPDDAEPTPEDLELLETTLQAIVGLRFSGSRAWEMVEQALEDEGWKVRTRLMWVAEARKGREYEQAAGRTRDEAFAQLHELTQMDEVPGVP